MSERISHIYDAPQTHSELLNASIYRDRICQLIKQYLNRVERLDKEPDLPGKNAFVVGIHGPWGCGKTTLMNMIAKKLADDRRALGEAPLVIVEFQAWKFNQREALWRALLSRTVAEVESQAKDRGDIDKKGKRTLSQESQAIREALYRDYEQSLGHRWGLRFPPVEDMAEAITEPKPSTVVKALLKTVEREEIKQFHARIAAFDQFNESFLALRQASKSLWLVLIDDLDRCLPESAIDIFEAIKVFLDAPGIVFILALDKQTIRAGLQVRYQERAGDRPLVDPDQYIEKVTNISFVVPTIPADDVEDFLKTLCSRESRRADSSTECLASDILSLLQKSEGPGVQPNPRRWIRLLNTAFLYDDILRGLGGTKDDKFAKLLLLCYRWGGFMEAVLGSWEILATFERAAQQAERDFATYKEICSAKYPELRIFAEDPELFRLLHAAPSVAEVASTDPGRRLFV